MIDLHYIRRMFRANTLFLTDQGLELDEPVIWNKDEDLSATKNMPNFSAQRKCISPDFFLQPDEENLKFYELLHTKSKIQNPKESKKIQEKVFQTWYDLLVEHIDFQPKQLAFSCNSENSLALEFWTPKIHHKKNTEKRNTVRIHYRNHQDQKKFHEIGVFQLDSKNAFHARFGVERILAAKTGEGNIFETKFFKTSILKSSELSPNSMIEKDLIHHRTIVDNLRAILFLIAYGVELKNSPTSTASLRKQNKVKRKNLQFMLRDLLRESIYHAWILGVKSRFLDRVIHPISSEYGTYFNFLHYKLNRVGVIIRHEEIKFQTSMPYAMQYLQENPKLSAEDLFHLTTRYGIPLNLLKKIKNHTISESDLQKLQELNRQHEEISRFAQRTDSGIEREKCF